jgi:hypothetical protein
MMRLKEPRRAPAEKSPKEGLGGSLRRLGSPTIFETSLDFFRSRHDSLSGIPRLQKSRHVWKRFG